MSHTRRKFILGENFESPKKNRGFWQFSSMSKISSSRTPEAQLCLFRPRIFHIFSIFRWSSKFFQWWWPILLHFPVQLFESFTTSTLVDGPFRLPPRVNRFKVMDSWIKNKGRIIHILHFKPVYLQKLMVRPIPLATRSLRIFAYAYDREIWFRSAKINLRECIFSYIKMQMNTRIVRVRKYAYENTHIVRVSYRTRIDFTILGDWIHIRTIILAYAYLRKYAYENTRTLRVVRVRLI